MTDGISSFVRRWTILFTVLSHKMLFWHLQVTNECFILASRGQTYIHTIGFCIAPFQMITALWIRQHCQKKNIKINIYHKTMVDNKWRTSKLVYKWTATPMFLNQLFLTKKTLLRPKRERGVTELRHPDQLLQLAASYVFVTLVLVFL